jgi:hypothetical protein
MEEWYCIIYPSLPHLNLKSLGNDFLLKKDFSTPANWPSKIPITDKV